MLSERELRLAYAIGATQNSTAPLNVGDVCNLEAYVTDFETPISEVLTELIEKKIASAGDSQPPPPLSLRSPPSLSPVSCR